MSEPRASSVGPAVGNGNTGAQALRTRLLQRRRSLSETSVAAASKLIVSRLADAPQVRQAARAGPVGVYWPVRGEPDVRLCVPIDRLASDPCAASLATPHGLTLPGHPAAHPRMLRWAADATLATAWGALRYPDDGVPAIDPKDHGMILVPAVAFDPAGNRLGNGGGWYDRLLANLSSRQLASETPLLVGIAHGFQLVEHLDAQRWDVPMHVVVTPDEVIVAVRPAC